MGTRRELSRPRGLVVIQQGEWDYACGLSCVLSAALTFGVPERRLILHRIVEGVSHKLLAGPGLHWDDLRMIAERAHMLTGPLQRKPQLVEVAELWIVRLPLQLDGRAYPHYVLARATTTGKIEIGDPYPHQSRRKTRTTSRLAFAAMCSTAVQIWPK